MLTVPPSVHLPDPRRAWRRKSQAQRVDTYTRVSLYGVLGIFPVAASLTLLSGEVTVAHGAGLAVVVAQGVLAFWLLRRTLHRYLTGSRLDRAGWAGVAAGMLAVAISGLLPLAGDQRAVVVVGTVFCVCLAVSPLLRSRGIGVLTLAGGTVLAAVLWDLPDGGWFPVAWSTGFLMVMLYTFRLSLWLLDVVRELDRAQATQAALAVAEERLRFSRDLHDVVGRSLSSVAVKSELAAELARRGDERAPGQMLEVRGLAQESLKEMRELVRGYRRVDLDSEVAGARSLLAAGGIRGRIAVDSATLSPGQQEAAGWAVREGVTNVLRHSRAQRCRIGLEGRVLTLSNDGVVGTVPVPARGSWSAPGSGLTGLAERMEPLGGSVTAGRASAGGGTAGRTSADGVAADSETADCFVLTVALPERGDR